MEQYKRAQVIILPTKEKSILQLNVIHNYLFSINNGANIPSQPYQHLYIISDDEIKEGDWCINLAHKLIVKPTNIEWANSNSHNLKKIIATTDTSLIALFGNDGDVGGKMRDGLPQPSQQFIEKYIEEYNRGNIITDILVEYEQTHWKGTKASYEDIFKLKINPKDNTITIKKLKDSWNRNEVITILNKLNNTLNIGSDLTLEEWIERNL